MDTRTLYVGNLPFSACEDDLRRLGSAHGEVDSVRLILDPRTGRFRGFGFIVFRDAVAAGKALEALSRESLDGRPLRVNPAQPGAEDQAPPQAAQPAKTTLSFEPGRLKRGGLGGSAVDRARRRAYFAARILEDRGARQQAEG